MTELLHNYHCKKLESIEKVIKDKIYKFNLNTSDEENIPRA